MINETKERSGDLKCVIKMDLCSFLCYEYNTVIASFSPDAEGFLYNL